MENIEKCYNFIKSCLDFNCITGTKIEAVLKNYINGGVFSDPTDIYSYVNAWYEDRKDVAWSTIKPRKGSKQLTRDWNSFLLKLRKFVKADIKNNLPYYNTQGDRAYEKIKDYDYASYASYIITKPSVVNTAVDCLMKAYKMLDDCEIFFLSDYGEALSGIDGQKVIDKLREHYSDGSYRDFIKDNDA